MGGSVKSAFSRLFHSVAAANILTFLIVLFAIVIPATYKYLSDVEADRLDVLASRLEVIAQQNASLIDVVDVLQLVNPNFLFTPEHRRVVGALRRMQTDFMVDNAVIYRRLPSGKFVYVADGNNLFPIGSPVTLHDRFPETKASARRAWSTGGLDRTDFIPSGQSKYVQLNLPLKIEGKVGAILMLNKFASPVAQTIRDRQVVIVAGLSVAVLAGAILFWLVTRRTLAPLGRLRRAAQAISRGDLDVEIPPPKGKNEIAELTSGFRQMVRDLKESTEQLNRHREHLESLVQERTSNLERSNAQLQQEIVQRERAQQALSESEAYLTLILETAPDGIITFSRQGDILGFNKSAERITGYPADWIVGRPVNLLLSESYREEFVRRLERYVESGQGSWLGRELQIEGRRKNGTVYPMMVGISEVTGPQETTFTAIVRDISELKRYQRELIEANQAKSDFLSHMSHELRSPLTAILGYTQLLQRELDFNDENRHDLQVIADSGEQLMDLINGVLDISKIEAGKIELHDESFEISSLIGSLVEMYRLKADESGVALSSDIAKDVPPLVRGDRGKLRQVLVNLLSNAIKFTESGQVRVTARNADQGIVIAVSDTGQGISAEQQALVFEPFRQSQTGISSGGGTGLGLSISKSFIELMGGELSLSSVEGEGSTFEFTLPLPTAEEGAPVEGGRRIVTGLAGDRQWRVLIVDDDSVNREYLRKTLGGIGFVTEYAKDGGEAIEQFVDFNPHLILMDIRMPGMNGLDATRSIRTMEGGDATPIIALTAHALDQDRENILAAGFDEMIPKPFEEAFLLERMAGFLPIHYLYRSVGSGTAS